ncbi:MAG: class I SAM-dependent methyltransferase [Planctomycetota bacterium]
MLRALHRLLSVPDKLAMLGLVRGMASQVQMMTISALHRADVLGHLDKPKSLEELISLTPCTAEEPLRHLLNLAVKRRVLACRDGRYIARSRLAKTLARDAQGPVASMLQEVTTYHHEVFDQLPQLLQGAEPLALLDKYGEVVAQSSRIMGPWIRSFTAAILGQEQGRNILELGCGSGEYLHGYSELHNAHRGIGIDYDPGVVRAAQRLLADANLQDRFSVQEADMRDPTTWPTGPFDVVTAHQNVYYFDANERQGLWQRCREHLTQHGELVLVTPTSGGPMSDYFSLILLSTSGCHRLPSVDVLLEELKAAGFRDLRQERLIPGDAVWGITARSR